jgi:hypothetical protein
MEKLKKKKKKKTKRGRISKVHGFEITCHTRALFWLHGFR